MNICSVMQETLSMTVVSDDIHNLVYEELRSWDKQQAERGD